VVILALAWSCKKCLANVVVFYLSNISPKIIFDVVFFNGLLDVTLVVTRHKRQ
jgi:hypothetical protein